VGGPPSRKRSRARHGGRIGRRLLAIGAGALIAGAAGALPASAQIEWSYLGNGPTEGEAVEATYTGPHSVTGWEWERCNPAIADCGVNVPPDGLGWPDIPGSITMGPVTSVQYVFSAGDVGKFVRPVVSLFSEPKETLPGVNEKIGPIYPDETQVQVSGELRAGEPLTAVYAGPYEVTQWRWYRCTADEVTCGDWPFNPLDPDADPDGDWTEIPGSQTSDPGVMDEPGPYVPTASDVGAYLRAVVALGDVINKYTSPQTGPIEPALGPPPPPPDGPQPPGSPQPPPPPVVRETANLEPVAGNVYIKLPGGGFRRLSEAEQVPLGSKVDATNGQVAVVTARNKRGATQRAWFWDGAFKLDQTGGAQPVTELRLTAPFARSAQRLAYRGRSGTRRLWGRGRCKCRTTGRHSSATVRGTKWLTIDRKRETITKVKQGRVLVRDFAARRTVTVKAGQTYVARARGRR